MVWSEIRRPAFLLAAAAVAVPVALVGALVHVRWAASQSRLPDRGETVVTVPGCPDAVRIRFDHAGVPHVRSDSEAAIWFAQGYVHARDRFFQMELSRRAAAGRLAEVFGEAAVGADRKMRIWRLDATARRHLALLSAEERRVLEHYTAGVNAALDRWGTWIAPELWLLGVEPEPWAPEDTLRTGVLLGLNLTWAMGEELRRGLELARLGPERAADLWGWSPSETRAWLPSGTAVSLARQPEDAITPPLAGPGSNSWAVAPARSATGRALLANDPHVGVQLPGTWYAVHLRSPTVHVAGLSVPGAPGVLVGHNEQVAWGLTMAMMDDQDLFVLTLDETGSRELVDGSWKPLRTVTERISVRWRETPVLLKVRLSESGPVVRDTAREVLALSWAGHQGPSALGAFVAMVRADSVAATAAAWEGVVSPSMNLVAADVHGGVLHQVVGLVPKRGRGAGRVPAPGADPRWAWRGFRPMTANPRIVDPDAGFVASANHDLFAEGDAPASRWFPGEFAGPWRIRRIRHVLETRSDWDVAGMVALQGDVRSEQAVAFLKLLWDDLEAHGGDTAQLLTGWDGTMQADLAAPTAFHRTLLALQAAVGGDEAERDGLRSTPVDADRLLRLLAGGLDPAWWDDVGTEVPETRRDVIRAVLTALDDGREVPAWGEVHRVHFEHPLLPVPLIGHLFGRAWSRGPFAVGGDGATVNAHYWSRSDPFRVVAIPSARFVVDVGNWDATLLGLPVGQSGRPWSARYADQLSSWLAVRPTRLPFSERAVEAATRSTLELEPR